MILSKILELYPEEEFLKITGFDDAIIGVDYTMKLVYSISKILLILMKDYSLSEEEALEYFDYNIFGANMGEKTPIFIEVKEDFYTKNEIRSEKLNKIKE